MNLFEKFKSRITNSARKLLVSQLSLDSLYDHVKLDTTHLKDCRLLPDRYHLLEHLPKNGKFAEIGVMYGDFSAEIISRCCPAELVLFDIEQRWGERFSGNNYIREEIGDSSTLLFVSPKKYSPKKIFSETLRSRSSSWPYDRGSVW